jgi:DNA repair protein RadC
MKIKDISLNNRPRERMMFDGINSLSDSEILAIILQNGSYGENVIDLSNKIISKFGLEKLSSCSLEELKEIKGIGNAKACKLLACFNLAKRINSGKIIGITFNKPKDVANYYKHKIGFEKKEYFYAVFLDTKNKIISEKLISIGTLNSSLVHPREIFKEAIKVSAASLILVHNHPSGSCDPSDEDLKVTKIISDSGDLIGIKLLDHVIVSYSGFWSWN